MKKLLLLTFLFTSFVCVAQQKIAVIDWQKTIGGNKSDRLNCIQPTMDGGYIFGGSSNSDNLGVKTDTCRGGLDYWIVKINSMGDIEWQKTYGGNKEDKLSCLQQTSDGGYILGGISQSDISGEKTENTKGFSYFDYWIIKINSTGVIEWQKTIGGNNNDNLTCLQQTTDDGFILGGYSMSRISGDKTEDSHSPTYSFVDFWIVKINSTGAIEWQKVIGGDNDDGLYAIQQTLDGGYILGGTSNSRISFEKTESSRGVNDYWVVKINSIGNIEWQKTIGGNGTDAIQDIKQTKDGGYILAGISSSDISGDKTDSIRGNSGFEDYWIIKINSLGNIEWQKVYGGSNSDFLKSINLTIDGGYILGGKSSSPISGEKSENFRGQSDYWILKVNSLGIIEWQKTIGGRDDEYLSNIIQTSDGNYLASGYSWSNISGEKTENNNSIYEDFWIVKLNEIYANKISGKIFQSQNSNCSQEINEYGTTSVIIIAEPYNFFGISDSTGKYTILTDTGTYQVKPIYPQILKPFLQQTVCPSSGYHTISFSQYGQDTSEINFANYEKQCPFLQLELAQGRMRRCFDNNATIKYCNIGNVDTTNVQVIIQLPEYVTFVSASNPNYIISGKKITFNIGNLRANECGTINLVTNVDCIEGIVGLTQCIKAQILPRNECVRKIQPDYAGWDQSEITIDGTCTGASVRFVIKNIGQNMADSSNCRIYKNAVQALSKNFKLLAGDSLVINVSATGHTYRLEADQTVHYPTTSSPNITIENCNNTSAANRNFVNQQEQDKSDIAVEKVCLEIRDSYDPNDKQVFPSGVGADKRVRHKVPLDFLIRFQNTGTDTAYKVVITDTLDQNLDLATLEFGASSHSYKFEFTGAGKPIMKFTFDKINLVDSFTNEPKSHGFISFKITPYDSIPNGTLVKNNADIYFDFNLPIKTNTTQVSIDDRLPTGATLNLVTSVKQNNTTYEAIYVYPNPFTQTATFEFVYNTKANQLLIYDMKGNVVAQENIAGKTTFQLQRANLSNGMYFYAVLNNSEEIIGRGKLVLQ